MYTNVINCPRCGANHTRLIAHSLTQPVYADGTIYTHWTMCPSYGEPLFLRLDTSDRLKPGPSEFKEHE